MGCLIRGFGEAFVRLPRSIQLFLGRILGSVFRLLGFRRRVIQGNLSIMFPGDTNQALRRELFRKSYDHLGHLILEILTLPGPFKRFVSKVARFEGLENWTRATDSGKNASFVLSGHVGNWEVMAATAGLSNVQILIVTKRLKPAWLHAMVEAGRRRVGVKGTYEPQTMKDILAHLKAGGTVGFVLDQYTGPPVGVRVPFFGIPVGTGLALATLVKRTGFPVIPVVNFRTPDGRMVTRVEAPLEWIEDPDPRRELARNTARYAEVLERFVREFPEQWLWSHRRFKGDLGPLGELEWEEGRK